MTKEPIFYRCEIDFLGQRWLEVIDNNGEYLVLLLFIFLSNRCLFIFIYFSKKRSELSGHPNRQQFFKVTLISHY
jgi:hypothetical protein